MSVQTVKLPLGWSPRSVKPKKRGLYKTTRTDLVDMGIAGGAYSYWNGKTWEPARSEDGTFWGDYSSLSTMLWADPKTDYPKKPEVRNAVAAKAENVVHSGATRKPGVRKPHGSGESVRDLNPASVTGSPAVPTTVPRPDAIQPQREAVRAHRFCPYCGEKLP